MRGSFQARTFDGRVSRLNAFSEVKPNKVMLRVRVIDPKLRRSVSKEHPALANLYILKQPQGTHFPVRPEEVKIIEALLAQ